MKKIVPQITFYTLPTSAETFRGGFTVESDKMLNKERLINPNGITYYKIYYSLKETSEGEILNVRTTKNPAYFLIYQKIQPSRR